MKKTILLAFILCISFLKSSAQFISEKNETNSFSLSNAVIYVDSNDAVLVKKSAVLFQQDFENVTGRKIPLSYNKTVAGKKVIII